MTAGQITARLNAILQELMALMAESQKMRPKVRYHRFVEGELFEVVPRGNNMCREIRMIRARVSEMSPETRIESPETYLSRPELLLQNLRSTMEYLRNAMRG